MKCQEAFDKLYIALMTALVLSHFHHNRETQVETDASDGVLAGVLSVTALQIPLMTRQKECIE